MSTHHLSGSSVKDFARGLTPWGFPQDWFYWPPDVFAFTSLVLRQTGCYRHAIADGEPRLADRQSIIEIAAGHWLTMVSTALTGAEGRSHETPFALIGRSHALLEGALNDLETLSATVTLERLRTLATEDERARRLCSALLVLHALADEACAGFGLLAAPKRSQAVAHCLANLLLTARGSLSSIPKHHGVVLPKMRTPQSGLTLRSFSHHLTFHSSEVEVMWRTMPWANIQENTVNMLLIPWPFEVTEQCFQAEPETFEPVRYFAYNPGDAPPSASGDDAPTRRYFDPREVVKLITKVDAGVGRLHVVILPELALTHAECRALLRGVRDALADGRLHHAPMVIAGVRQGGRAPTNEIRLAAYFAGRWYELRQEKHHRWKLDRNQILQYGLEGCLATARNWYEHIALSQRHLTFLAPTGWLTLCPLICEDLAQLEPVSDLIRGVGPTLLVALLMDGPQLKERWSARYASVLADDPGTAVLTLTSLGMAARSRARGGPVTAAPDRTIALWKDQITGWHPLSPRDGCEAILVTLSADWHQEFTADGRGDHQNSAVFKLEGVRSYALGASSMRVEAPGPALRAAPPSSAPSPNDERLFAEWSDIRELAAATYALDAAIQCRGEHAELLYAWLLGHEQASRAAHVPARLRGLVDLVRLAQRDPGGIGVVAREERWPTRSLELAAEVYLQWLSAYSGRTDSAIDYWEALGRQAIERLERSAVDYAHSADVAQEDDDETFDQRRISRAVPLAVLLALHARLEGLRNRHAIPRAHRSDPDKQPPAPVLSTLPQPAAAAAGRDSGISLSRAAALLCAIEHALRKFAV